MLLPKFDFHEPHTVDEACQILAEYGAEAKVIAGGTDLLVDMKKRLVLPKQLLSISKIEEMKRLDLSGSVIKIGSCLTVADIASANIIAIKWNALCAGARSLGSPQIRNLATIGGNIGSASPAADLLPSLISYDANLVLKKNSGERVVSLDQFFVGPRRTKLDPDEIISEIRMDVPPPYSGASYISLGIRTCQDIKIVNVASFITLESHGGIIKNARIVLGCVGPTCIRAVSAEKLLVGEKPGEAVFIKAGEAAMRNCSPRGSSESRASAEYKKDMVGVLTRRTLNEALMEAMRQ